MKKLGIYTSVALMLGMGTINTSCMGSWGLTKTVYNWNDGATGNKFVDNLLFYIFLVPVPFYGLSLTVDFFVLNLIEFWTGANPTAMKPGERERQIVKGKDGNKYQIVVTQNQYQITPLSGEQKGKTVTVFFTPENQTWSINKNNTTNVIAKMLPETNKAEIYKAGGSVELVDLNQLNTKRILNASY
jgi:hypothetical protein